MPHSRQCVYPLQNDMPIKTDAVSSIELPEYTPEGGGLGQKPARRRGTRRSISVDSTRNSSVCINVFECLFCGFCLVSQIHYRRILPNMGFICMEMKLLLTKNGTYADA